MMLLMHIAMHVKSMKRLPTHDVIYSIVPWYLKERHDLSEVPFGSLVIVRLFHQRFFHGPTVVNGRRVPLNMTNSKRKESKVNVYCNDMFIRLFYTLYLNYMKKKVK